MILKKSVLSALLLCVCIPQWAGAEAYTPPPLDAYGDLPAIEDASISESGKKIAVVGVFNDQRSAIISDEAGKVTMSAALGEAKVRDLEWAGDDFLLLYSTRTVPLGDGFTEKFVEARSALTIPANGGKLQKIFGDSDLIPDFIISRYGLRKLPTGWAGFFAGYRLKQRNGNIHNRLDVGRGEFDSRKYLYSVDLGTNRSRQVGPTSQDYHWPDWLVNADGEIAYYLDINQADRTWQILSKAGKAIAKGALRNQDTGIDLQAIGPDKKSVIYSIYNVDGSYQYYEVPLDNTAPKPFMPEADISSLLVEDSIVVGYQDNNSDRYTHFLDPARQAALKRVVRAFGRNSANVLIKGWSGDFGQMIIRTTGKGDSGTWYDVNVKTLSVSVIGKERPAIGPSQVGSVSRIVYTAGDGMEMDGILTLPPHKEARNLPVIMLPHGGPHSHDVVEFNWWAQAFASRGYAVFQPNFRGSTNKGQEFVNAAYNEWGRKMQTDISDGLNELAKRGIVDPKRACIVGASYGGYAALSGVTLQSGIYRCAVSVAGVSDLERMSDDADRKSGESVVNWRIMKRFLGDKAHYAAVSPARQADKANAPILLLHGEADTVVPFHQSTIMANALKRANKPYELQVLKNEDHWLSFAQTRKQMLTLTMGFVQRHNPAN